MFGNGKNLLAILESIFVIGFGFVGVISFFIPQSPVYLSLILISVAFGVLTITKLSYKEGKEIGNTDGWNEAYELNGKNSLKGKPFAGWQFK